MQTTKGRFSGLLIVKPGVFQLEHTPESSPTHTYARSSDSSQFVTNLSFWWCHSIEFRSHCQYYGSDVGRTYATSMDLQGEMVLSVCSRYGHRI